jgi:hypothetical protein
MPTRKRTLELEIIGETRKAVAALRDIEGHVTKTAKTFSTTGKLLTGAFAGREAIDEALQAIDRAERVGDVYALTEQIISQTGSAANVTADHIKDLANETSLLTGIDKALIGEGNNVLLTFKNIRNEVGEGNQVFDRASRLFLDVSTVMGTDTRSAALQLGKALNDPVSQMGALSRAGLTFTQQQKAQIKALADSGDLLEAQKLLLSELETQLGGTAVAAADASDKIRNSFLELQEQVGNFLLPYVGQLNIEIMKLSGDALGALEAQTGQNRQSATFLAGALNEFAQELARVDRLGRDGAEGLGTFEDKARELIATTGITDNELRRLRDGLPELVKQFDLTSGQADVLASIIEERLVITSKDMADNANALAGELAALRGETQNVGTVTSEVVPSAEALALQMERQAGAARAAREEIALQREAIRGMHDPLFRMVELNEDLAEAQEAVDEAANPGEFGAAVRERARVIADLQQTYRDLKSQGVDPTSAAVRLAFRDLGLPDSEIDKIFAQFDEMERNFENRRFSMQIAAPIIQAGGGPGFTPRSSGSRVFVGHSGIHAGLVPGSPRDNVPAVLKGQELVIDQGQEIPVSGMGSAQGLSPIVVQLVVDGRVFTEQVVIPNIVRARRRGVSV